MRGPIPVAGCCRLSAGAGHPAWLLTRPTATPWRHDRRKDAYLAYVAAARALIPVTEELFCAEERDYVARQTSGTELTTETLEETITWADTLWTPLPAEPSAEWRKKAPELLHGLTTGFDRIDLEGPPDVIEPGLAVIASAHRLIVGSELFAKKAEQEAAEGGSATEMDLLRAEVHH
ncbi:hypothetical protein ACF1GT_00570 [Streptomyces sp. NPDC014636]|uniref:hypothetical protein n=1 Tax=Streptomyces sp. NPDC014636 TaxID=3364876 RepID=UPI0036F98178